MRGRSYEVPSSAPTYDTLTSEDNILLNSRNSYGILSEEDADTYEPPSLQASTRDSSSFVASRSKWRGLSSTATTSTGTRSPLSQQSSATPKMERTAVDKELNSILQKYTSKDKLKLSQILGKYTATKEAEETQTERRMDEMVSKYSKDRQSEDGSRSSKKGAVQRTEEPREQPEAAPSATRRAHPSSRKGNDGRPPLVTVVDYPTSDMVEVFGKLKTPKAKEIGHLSPDGVLSSMSKDDSLPSMASVSGRSSVVHANSSLRSSGEGSVLAKGQASSSKTTLTDTVQSHGSFHSARSKESSSSRASRRRMIKSPKSKDSTVSKESNKSYATAKSKESTIKSKDSVVSLHSKNSFADRVSSGVLPLTSDPRDPPIPRSNSNASAASKKDLLVKTSSLEVTQKVLISPASPLVFGPPRVLNRSASQEAKAATQPRSVVESVRSDRTISSPPTEEQPVQSMASSSENGKLQESQPSTDDYAALVVQATSAEASAASNKGQSKDSAPPAVSNADSETLSAIPTVTVTKSGSTSGSVSSRRSRGSRRASLMKSSLSLSQSSGGEGSFGAAQDAGAPKNAPSKASSIDHSFSGSQGRVHSVTFSDDEPQHTPESTVGDDATKTEAGSNNCERQAIVSVADSDELQMQTLSTIVSGSGSVEQPVQTTVSADDATHHVPATLSRVSSTPARIPSSSSSRERSAEALNEGKDALEATSSSPILHKASIEMLSSGEDEILVKMGTKTSDAGNTGVYSSEDDIVRVREKEFGRFEEFVPPVNVTTADPSDPIDQRVATLSQTLDAETQIKKSQELQSVQNVEAFDKKKPGSPKRLNVGFLGRMQRPKKTDNGKQSAPGGIFSKAFKLNAKRNETNVEHAPSHADAGGKRETGDVAIAAAIDDKNDVQRVAADCKTPMQDHNVVEDSVAKTTAPITLVDHRSSRKVEMIGKIVDNSTEIQSECLPDGGDPMTAVFSKKAARKPLALFLAKRFGRTTKENIVGLHGGETAKPEIADFLVENTENNEKESDDSKECHVSKETETVKVTHEKDNGNEGPDDFTMSEEKAPLESVVATDSDAALKIATKDALETTNEAEKETVQTTITQMTDAMMAWCTPKGDTFECAGKEDGFEKESSTDEARDKDKQQSGLCSADAIDLTSFSPSGAMTSMKATVMTWCSPRGGPSAFACNEDNTTSDEAEKAEPMSGGKRSEFTSSSCSDAIDGSKRSAQETVASTTAALVGWCTPRSRASEQKSDPSDDSDHQIKSESPQASEKKQSSCSNGIDETMASTQETMSTVTSAVGNWCTPRGYDSAVATKEKGTNVASKTAPAVQVCYPDVDEALKQIEMFLPPSTSEKLQGMCASLPQQSATLGDGARSHQTADAADDSTKQTWASNMASWWAQKATTTDHETMDKGAFMNCVDSVADKVACVDVVDEASIGDPEDFPVHDSMNSVEDTLPVANPPVVEAVDAIPPSVTAVTTGKAASEVVEDNVPPSKDPPRSAGRFKKTFRNPFAPLRRLKSRASKTVEAEQATSCIDAPDVESTEAQVVAEESPKRILTPVAVVKVENDSELLEVSRDIPSVLTAGDKSSVGLNTIQARSSRGDSEHQDDQDLSEGRFKDLHVTAVSEENSIDDAIGESIDYLTLVKEKREARSKRVANIVEDEELEAPLEEYENVTAPQHEETPFPSKKSNRQRIGFRRQQKQKSNSTEKSPRVPTPSGMNASGSEDVSSHLRVCAVSDEEVEEMEMEASFSTSVGSHYPPSVQSENTEAREDIETRSTRNKTSAVVQRKTTNNAVAQNSVRQKNSRGKDEISMGPSVNSGVGTFDDDLSGVFAPTGGGKWFW